MKTTWSVQVNGKPYEADLNFNGSVWQVIGYSGPARVVLSEHESRAEAVSALAALVK